MSRDCSTGKRLRGAAHVLAAVATVALFSAPPALADSGGLPLRPNLAPLIVTAVLFVVLIAGLSLPQFKSAWRRRSQAELKSQSAPSARKEIEP